MVEAVFGQPSIGFFCPENYCFDLLIGKTGLAPYHPTGNIFFIDKTRIAFDEGDRVSGFEKRELISINKLNLEG